MIGTTVVNIPPHLTETPESLKETFRYFSLDFHRKKLGRREERK